MTNTSARVAVVVANPDETVCEVLGRIIESGGHEAVRVTDAEQVSAAVLSAPADAVLLDLGPGNVEQLRALRSGGSARGAEATAVVISTGPANALLAWQADADAVLTRPFPAAELAESLNAALARTDGERAALRAERIAELHASS